MAASSATVTGAVNPRGRRVLYVFQYGTTAGYGGQTSPAPLNAAKRAVGVSAALTSLLPLTTYHYRLVATSCRWCSGGTAFGPDVTVGVGGYENPAYTSTDAPDPDILDNGGVHQDYWAFTTGNGFPILHSSDLVHWVSAGTALAGRPAWAAQSGDWHPWAPNVAEVPEACPGTASSSCYVMYYVSLSASTGANCVAVATSVTPGGPYADQGPLSNGVNDAAGRPVGCGDDTGYGMIDPSLFVDPATGQPYLYVSEDFACPPGSNYCTSESSTLQPTISVLRLAPDYLHVEGPRVPLFAGDANTWEAAGVAVPTVEGPSAILHAGTYYLLYSGGSWRTTYGMGYATASSPLGPFTKSSQNPILAGTSEILSPGGADAPVTGPRGGLWLLYHARAGSYANGRTLRMDPLSWRSTGPGPDAPVISGPTVGAEPLEP